MSGGDVRDRAAGRAPGRRGLGDALGLERPDPGPGEASRGGPGREFEAPGRLGPPLGGAPDEATAAQWRAADPSGSAWVSANAGSGKTRVLTDRVARLLLEGVSPGRILCLTYTKAAASEMELRLLARLGAWAMLPDDALRAQIASLGDRAERGEGDLARARRLFAQAIETPGGLKIQTIHAFCAALLRRFPLEAGVSPGFQEMDDAASRVLRDEVLEAMADGEARPDLDAVAALFTGETLGELAERVLAWRDRFEGGADLRAALGVAPGLDEDRLAAEAFAPGDRDVLAEAARRMAEGSKTDQGLAPVLAAAAAGPLDVGAIERLEGPLLTGKDAREPFAAKLGRVPTKKTREAEGFPADALDALMLRIEAARPRRLALAALRRTEALHRFARRLIAEHDAAKARRGWLDFDDLILRAHALMREPGVAAWVLYKLDGGIDHILVDEAQDTSPAQWRVIEALAAEFTAGEGAAGERPRTLFVVGDPKQSIFSFQGADPSGFAASREAFARRLEAVGRPLRQVALRHSFRSSPAILRAVDAMLGEARGIAPEADVTDHVAFHEGLPGRVDLWPPSRQPDRPERQDWLDATDRVAEDDARITLARRVVAHVHRMIREEVPIPDGAGGLRPVRAGDVLVLVRSRDALFDEIIRHAKQPGSEVPVAGADRLRVGGELAVRDVMALLAFLALPDDDLSLAEALRSPLMGWSEQELFDLAHRRPPGHGLWRALRARRDSPRTEGVLRALLDDTDFLRPYDLIERVLTRHGGRARLAARLGPEAEEGIDALLDLALAYERLEVPTLTGFVSWLREDASEIKRQAEGAGDLMRVMTVHGAKGLEAPVVILPQTFGRGRGGAALVPSAAGPLWRPPGDRAPAMEQAARAADAAEEAERLRLLYVAMTRARSWLMVAGVEPRANREAVSWHDRARGALEALGAVPHEQPTGAGLRLETGDWSGAAAARPAAPARAPAGLPDWALTPPRPPEEPPRPLSPSALGGAKTLPGEVVAEPDEDDEWAADEALERGAHLHRLLEHLPMHPGLPPEEVARDLLLEADPPAEEADIPGLLAEAEAILRDPRLAPLFAPGTLAEVPVAAEVAVGGRPAPVLGAIDRLVVGPDRVLAVDFKTNRLLPARPEEVPRGILRQMGAYAAALAAVYPGRAVETAVLWTRGPALMPLPPALVAEVLATVDP